MQIIEVPVILGFVPGTGLVLRQHAEKSRESKQKVSEE